VENNEFLAAGASDGRGAGRRLQSASVSQLSAVVADLGQRPWPTREAARAGRVALEFQRRGLPADVQARLGLVSPPAPGEYEVKLQVA
jgi:hypothetical protein